MHEAAPVPVGAWLALTMRDLPPVPKLLEGEQYVLYPLMSVFIFRHSMRLPPPPALVYQMRGGRLLRSAVFPRMPNEPISLPARPEPSSV
jgi:hypothetical protein